MTVKAKDARSAQNISVIAILPIFFLIGIQLTGIAWLTPLLTLALGLTVIVLDFLALRVAVRLFQRESIVISWQ